MLPSKTEKSSDEIEFNDGYSTDKKVICNKFNKFFIESIRDINQSIPIATEQINTERVNYNFKFELVNTEQIHKISNKLKKKVNKSDPLNSIVWNDAMDYIGFFLCQIINESLMNGVFPDDWKTATITPIPKISNTMKANEFRPINSMPNEEKILECVVKEQLMKFLETNNIITENQSAYRSKHSCESALNFMISNFKEAKERGETVIAIFLDLKRAFETVDRQRMAKKLENIGINNTELHWFESYMTNRKQIVKYKNEKSEEMIVPIGLAQGTQLSVWLFLLYINDIVTVPDFGQILLFADDTVLIIKSNSVESAAQKANHDLEKIYNWLNVNKLKLNIGKTNYMIFDKNVKNDVNYEVKIGQQIIERVEQIKYLGVLIDNRITMESQIDSIIKKASSKINFLYRLKKKLTFETKKIVYNSIILPHFDFCSTLYIGCKNEQMNTLQVLQNRAMRIILDCEFGTHTEFMLNALKWMSINQRYKYNTLIYVFKIKNGLAPQYLANKLEYNGNFHNRNTRNRQELRLPNLKTELARKSIFYNGIKMFNELPSEIRRQTELYSFKRMVKAYVLENVDIR